MTRENACSRRDLLRIGAAIGLTGGLSRRAGLAADAPASTARRQRPLNVIFMVSDGMSTGVPSLTEPFAQIVRGKGTHWNRLEADPTVVRGLLKTDSLNSMVTDSSAASSAWGSGSRVNNGAVNMLPDGTKLTPIGHLVRDAGLRFGLVTTTTVTHATPAGFAAIQQSRGDEHLIAPQYLDLVDVVMGGGRTFFDPASRKDRHDLIGAFKAKGYAYCSERSQLETAKTSNRILGLFSGGHVPYTIDRMNDAQLNRDVPTLAEMTRAALDVLGRSSPNGFVLQVEGGRVDHCAHSNDAAGILWDQLEFDDAIGVAVEFARQRGDTLVFITSDHGNSNPGLNGMGGSYADSTKCFERLTKAKASTETIGGTLQKTMKKDKPLGVDATIEIIRDLTSIELSKSEAAAVAATVAGHTPPQLNSQHANFVGVLGQALGNHNGVGWTGVSHTADWVLSMAIGPRNDQFAGLMHHTDVHNRVTALLELARSNAKTAAA